MCGRFALTSPPQAVRDFFKYREQPNFPPRYNIAPTQPVAVLYRGASDGDRHFRLMRWGFLPGFVEDPKGFPLLINARSETLALKASFRTALRRRRCVLMADCFYEWRRIGKTKANAQPFLIRRADGAPLAFAGLWETWTGPNGEELDTACIVTTAANGATAALHDRLPAVLEPQHLDLWLDPDERSAAEAHRLLRPAAEDILDFFEIGPAVNKVENDGPDIQARNPAVASRPPPDAMEERQGSLF